MMNPICFIRVDANKNIGYGHLSRCKIIADELSKNSIDPVFLLFNTDKVIITELVQNKNAFYILPEDNHKEIIACKQKYKAQKYIIIFDTDVELYYEKNVQLNLINAGIKLVFFTFWDKYKYYAHIIVNQNPISQTHHYKTADYTRKLLGPNYMIFHDQFLGKMTSGTSVIRTDNLKPFISFGGTDEPDRTYKTIQAFREHEINIEECNIVIGTLYKNEKKLFTLLEKCKFPFHVYKQIDNISEIMIRSNIALCSGGLTLWELGVLDIPTAIISYSKREMITASYVDENEWAFYLGSIQKIDGPDFPLQFMRFIKSDDLKKRSEKLKNILNIHGKKEIVSEIVSVLND